MLFTRLRRIGLLSLSTLFFGGLLLFLTGLNGLIGSDSVEGKVPSRDNVRLFLYGSELSIQSWLAILGVGFGLLSYGFHEAYIHLFDWWCSNQAQRDGLDYGLYLNSQPQAPVLYGYRGFTGLITLRYLLALISIGASIGYKFGIINAELKFVGHISKDNLHISIPTFDRSDTNDNPWLADKPGYTKDGNRAFYHEEGEDRDPPHSIIMAASMGCDFDILPAVGWGTIYSREYVIIANMTDLDVKAESMVFGLQDYLNGDWLRIIVYHHIDDTFGGGWLNSSDSDSSPVVEFRFQQLDEVHIRWADYQPSNYYMNKGKWPVVRHVKYKLNYGVAEVRRQIKDGRCSMLEYNTPIQLLSVDDKPPNHGDFVPVNKNFDGWIWARSILTSWGVNPRDGVSGILQVGMSLFGSWMVLLNDKDGTDHTFGKFVSADTRPYGSEITPYRIGGPQGVLEYPVLNAHGWTATGIFIPGAYVFLVLGCLSIFVAFIRVYVGPPVLTSWMGQHIMLAQDETISMPQQDLACGYKAAKIGLGKLTLR
ncbi:hypothetical protein QSH57_004204 [Fusarium oxysporum f. sp. vasinfectum]|nr:hypothetical protein QSH57_004204 [Fusarium oxysporum f. sp. vasinfectum]